MKFQTSIETWAIQPHRFLQAFSQPGNQEHQLWSELSGFHWKENRTPLKFQWKNWFLYLNSMNGKSVNCFPWPFETAVWKKTLQIIADLYNLMRPN